MPVWWETQSVQERRLSRVPKSQNTNQHPILWRKNERKTIRQGSRHRCHPWGSGPPVSLWRAAHLRAQAPASAGPRSPEKSARPGQRLFHSGQAVPDQAGTRRGPQGAAGRRGEHCLATGPRRGLAKRALVALQAWVQDRRKTSGRAPSRPSLAWVPGGLCRIRAALASPSVPWESAFCRRPRPPSLLPHRLLPPCPHPSPTRRPIT